MKKTLVGILMTTVMLLSLAAPLLAIPVTADDADWYMTVPGVLASDYYSLYPYEKQNLVIGFSKFGELINSADNVGMEYAGTVDPYAYPSGSSISTTVPKRMWVQGWYMNITYVHRTLGERWVWAGALHSDSVVYGNDWIRVDFANDWSPTYGLEDFRDPGYFIGAVPYGTTLVQGGRKTNGTAVTDPIEVLYDGPREFIAITRTTLYDHLIYGDDGTESDVALLQLAITIRFDKVKKCVVLYKDVKSLLVEKEGIEMKIQFSNRGEVDLGTPSIGISSYAHFWTEGMGVAGVDDNFDNVEEGLSTVYDFNYAIIQTEDPEDTNYPGFSAAGPYPQVHASTYDYAQAINPAADVAWSAAFWPSLSDWSIDGWDQWWHSMSAVDPHYIDYRIPDDEPMIPFYIGEWDFVLRHTLDSDGRTQFRGVTQYAVTNLHDGDDENIPDETVPWPPFLIQHENVIDTEMMYYLNETFNPWDLRDATWKDTERQLEWSNKKSSLITKYTPAVYVSDDEWDDYCNFAERIYRMDTGVLLTRGTGYTATYDPVAGTIEFSGLPTSANCKILYSTKQVRARIVVIIGDAPAHDGPEGMFGGDPGRDGVMFTKDDLNYGRTIENLVDEGISVLGVLYPDSASADPDAVLNFQAMADGTGGDLYYGDTAWDASVITEVQTRIGSVGVADVVFVPDLSGSMSSFLTDIQTKIGLIIDGLALDDVWFGVGSFVDYPAIYSSYGYTAEYGTVATGDYAWNMDCDMTEDGELVKAVVNNLLIYYGGDTPQDYARAMYESIFFEWRKLGRYEWVEVGTNAATVDNAGAALVAEVYDSVKGIGIGIAGADMEAADPNNDMPWVMSKFGAGTTVDDYKDSIFRAALNDDWCTYWPVASSNMIAVGGPLATATSGNLLSYYVNDFTDAFYGLAQFADDPVASGAYANAIVGISCWNRKWPTNVFPWEDSYNVYRNLKFSMGTFSLDWGYAVVATYKDINGTVIFDVWGNTGRDTYYASLWLHGDEMRGLTPAILELQRAPKGVTSIILQIDYADPKHPTYSIPELLGTISETVWTDTGAGDVSFPWIKGGLHDP